MITIFSSTSMAIRRMTSFCLALVVFGAGLSVYSQSNTILEAHNLVQGHLASNPMPGLSVCVSKSGKIVWAEGFGLANLESLSPVNPYTTKFRIGSISKPITAAALGILVDEGRVQLESEIQTYVPDFPLKKAPITVSQVAGHLAGIRHYRGAEFLSTKRYPDVASGLDIFKDDPLLFTPGSKYAYSSYGWNLISMVIENVSGMAFLDYLQEAVFDAIGMFESSADFAEKIIPGRTGFYMLDKQGFVNAPFVDNSYKWAGGGFLSTAADLAKFANAHLSGRLMQPNTFALFTKSLTTADGKETGYGIGWRSSVDTEGDPWVGHSGGSVGGTSMLQCYPEQQLVVVILANLSSANLSGLSGQVASLFKEHD